MASKLLLATLFGLFACGQHASNSAKVSKDTSSQNSSMFNSMHQEQELWTLYSKSEKVYHVKRLISNDHDYFLLTYEINASLPEQAHQTLIEKQPVNAGELEKTKKDNSSFGWQPFKATPVLFVQLQYS